MRAIVTAAILSVAISQSLSAGETVVDDAYLSNRAQGENWAGYGRTYFEQRYSPLDAINAGNVKDIGIEWYLDLPNDRSLTGTPLAVDGVLYFNGSYNVIRAVDAVSGVLLWEYDPKVIEHAGERMRIKEIREGRATYYIVPFEFLDREYRFFEFNFQPEGTEIMFEHKIKVQLWRQD